MHVNAVAFLAAVTFGTTVSAGAVPTPSPSAAPSKPHWGSLDTHEFSAQLVASPEKGTCEFEYNLPSMGCLAQRTDDHVFKYNPETKFCEIHDEVESGLHTYNNVCNGGTASYLDASGEFLVETPKAFVAFWFSDLKKITGGQVMLVSPGQGKLDPQMAHTKE